MVSLYKETARVFKAFCDENRLQILEMLRSGEKQNPHFKTFAQRRKMRLYAAG